MAKEALGLISALPARSSTIVLDERGKALSSAGFADLLKNHLGRGTSDLGLMIGGPDGHGQAIRDSAGFILSLGAMTWPHRLVRTMLAEQIYRAVTILINHPYHRP
jgi:23S rRNA (pseudouridine1915-N3)-methyltransferase